MRNRRITPTIWPEMRERCTSGFFQILGLLYKFEGAIVVVVFDFPKEDKPLITKKGHSASITGV